ncbi:MAG: 30S ribosomal protein S12 methylthiotransferase RimO [Gemmatimonadaceae bacterium]
MRFAIVTLGCDKNTVDSERYRSQLTAHGGEHTAHVADADVVVVNTCGFIDAAKRESIDALLRAARLEDGERPRLVAAVGCMVERYEAELRAALPEIDLFLGTSAADRLVPALAERGVLDAVPSAHPGERVYAGDLAHVRYLKVSEGCDHGCAFCAIPLMRGRHRSFALGDIIREAQLLELQGAREINLVAQDLAHYGRDRRDGGGLAQLIEALLRETGIPWYRLLYIYSAGLKEPVLELMVREPRIVSYLDIPMQHASDAVLARMRRPERQGRQRAKIQAIRERLPDIAIRTTVIVGFPGETEDDVDQLCEFLEEVQLERVGVFTFSRQEGTLGYEMPDDVPDAVKRERQERVESLQRVISAERYERFVGRTLRAIVDRPRANGERTQARLAAQADDIDGVTWLDGKVEGDGEGEGDAPAGALVDVIVSAVVDDFDFEASLAAVVESASPPRGASPAAARRTLPLAPSTAGSFGRRRRDA